MGLVAMNQIDTDQENEVVPKVLTEEDKQRLREQRKELQLSVSEQERKKLFRNAYCFKLGYDFTSIKPYCKNLVMVTDGWSDPLDDVRERIEENMRDYDSDMDVVIMAGRSVDLFLAGQFVQRKALEKPKAYQSYAIAMYLNPNYIFYEVHLDPTIISHEIGNR